MCGDHACSCKHDLVAVQQADDESSPITIWGPFSVEMPSVDRKLIRLAAVERALPDIIARARFSVRHHDQIVGEIQPLAQVDPKRVPDGPVRMMVQELVKDYKGLPTAILPVSETIAAVFPRLAPMIGKRVAFAGGIVWGDNRTNRIVRNDILQGKLDSFSIAGTSFKARPIEYCDPATGCMTVEEVEDMDGSAITIGSSRGGTGSPFDAKTMNPGAAFVVVQHAAEAGGKTNPLKVETVVHGSTSMAGEEKPKETVQTAPPAKAAPAAPAGSAAVQQTTAPSDPATSPSDAAPEQVWQVQMTRRIEDLEKTLAQLLGPAPGATDSAPPAPEAQARLVARQGDVAKIVQEALTKAMAPFQTLLEAHKPPATPAPKATPAPVAQAKPQWVVQTPEPATPGGTGNSQDELKDLLQAVDAGDLGAVKDLARRARRTSA